MGNLLKVTVHPADFQDAEGAELLLHGLAGAFPRFQKLWADQAYKPIRDWVATELGWELETVARPIDQAGFVLLPRRWVVERTLAWLSRYRRLSKGKRSAPLHHNRLYPAQSGPQPVVVTSSLPTVVTPSRSAPDHNRLWSARSQTPTGCT